MKRFLTILGIIGVLLIASAIGAFAITNTSGIDEIDVSRINSPEECIEILEEIANNNPTEEADIDQNYENEQAVKQRLLELVSSEMSLSSATSLEKDEILEQIEDKIAAYDILKMTFALENRTDKVEEYQGYIEEANQLIEDIENDKDLGEIQMKLTELK